MTTVHRSPQKSTIVRAATGLTRSAIRVGFRTLEVLAPEAGSRLALRLWCTPPRHRRHPPARMASGPGGAGTFTGPYDGAARRIPVDGGTVPARTWGSGPAVYLVHGWGGYAGQLHGFVAPLVLAGYRVIAFDAPGHGHSGPGRPGPRRTTLPKFAEALSAAVAAEGPAHAIVAHSLGGTATGLAVLDGLRAERLVLIAPLADPVPYTVAFRQALGIGPAVGSRFLHRMAALIGRDLADLDIAGRARRADDLPALLVLHDRGDREVPPADGAALAAAWPGVLEFTDGLGHRRILTDRAVIEKVVRFVAQPSAGAPAPAPAPAAAAAAATAPAAVIAGHRRPAGVTTAGHPR